MHNTRREFLARSLASGAALAGGSLLVSRVALGAPAATDARFIFVILRGALDGLAAVPPIGDPDYARLRGELALSAAAAVGGAFRLDDTFALHPSLTFLAQQWQAKQLAVVHAVSTPYRERSHFDAQDVLGIRFRAGACFAIGVAQSRAAGLAGCEIRRQCRCGAWRECATGDARRSGGGLLVTQSHAQCG